MVTHKGVEVLEVPDREAWRAWLAANHDTSLGVWLVFARKNSGVAAPTYEEAVLEALAYGWIDSTGNRLDEQRTLLRFSPRKRGSVWATSNKARVERLIAEGRMAEPGLAKVEAAKRDGSWALLEAVDALVVEDDLAAALDARPEARRNFEAVSESVKKQVLYRVYSAKRPETRARRIEEAVRLAAENDWAMIGQGRQPAQESVEG
jgi:uncharacterized protein YdeI (YjbR/CyaY-like superfamily)